MSDKNMLSRDFTPIFDLIQESKKRVYQKINHELIDLYWNLGRLLAKKILADGWGKSTIKELAEFIKKQDPTLKGFSDKNLWRMRQFYEIYSTNEKLSTLSRELSWSHNCTLISRCKTQEERLFYLQKTLEEKYSVRELDRQISRSLYQRQLKDSEALSPVARELYPQAQEVFKDRYIFDFLGLPTSHSEKDLQTGLVEQLKNFILELGRDFSFIGQEYRLQVGNQDFYVDLLFYHRDLQCLVAFELKVDKFKPEFMGQLEFYLEALDRDVKKEHENPTIGVLLCKDKDEEVVEYALNRSLSPALVAQYETKLIPKNLLQQKLHELDYGDQND